MHHPVLRLREDILSNGAALALPPLPRMIFVVHGALTIAERSLSDGEAWHGEGPLTLYAGNWGASVWRWELASGAAAVTTLPGVSSREKLSVHPRTLPKGDLLLRGDSVGFPAGGCAHLHRHQGPGIRCLIEGGIRIDTHGSSTSYGPSRFIRVMLLPRELMGKSSLQYVNEEDENKPRVQRYKILADAPIARPTD
jgi:hypothetical protein